MKIINKNFLLKVLYIYILLMIFYLVNIYFFNKTNFFYTPNIGSIITLRNFELKNNCNIKYLGDNSIFIRSFSKIINKQKNIKSIRNKKNNIFVNNNLIYYKNKKFLYLGDLIKNNKKYAVFILLTVPKKFYFVSKSQKLDDTNLTLIENYTYKIIFKYKNKKLIIKKEYINIKKYQKDFNEKNHSN